MNYNTISKLVNYNPITGVFTRISSGKQIGSIQKNGYVYAFVDGKLRLLHRVAFLLMTGSPPRNDIDHINGIRSSNQWINLREATRKENLYNKRSTRELPKNVYLHKSGNYRVKMKIENKTVHFGYFKNLEDAIIKAKTVQMETHGSFAPTRVD